MKVIKDGVEVDAMKVNFQEEVVFYAVKCCQTFYDQSLVTISFSRKGYAMIKHVDDWVTITYCPFCGKKIDIFNIQSL